MTSFKLQYPEEPPIGTVVQTTGGLVFTRIHDSWRKKGEHHPNWYWANIIDQYREVYLVEPDPEEGALRRHKTISTHFIVYVGGEWQEYHFFSNNTWAKLYYVPNMENFE